MPARLRQILVGIALAMSAVAAAAQEKSVNPGINDRFRDPNVKEFQGRFETESREVYAHRKQIVAACDIKPGQTVADIGSGTGLFTRMFSDAVGKDGRVFAVDITQKFLDHVQRTSREAGQRNVETVKCTDDSTKLPPDSVDVAFICDTYHHFEFPQKTMQSLFRALKSGGRLVLVDYRRIEGVSTDRIMKHVRAGQEVFEAEVKAAGFQKVAEKPDLLKDNYFVVFQKPVSQEMSALFAPGHGRGMGRGRGMRRGPAMGRGPGPDMRKDQEIFHFLLQHHAKVRRTVKRLDNGVETLTESDNPQVAAKIQEHVASMHKRVKEGRGLRFWDQLFFVIFKNHARISMDVKQTDKGVRVKETSANPFVVKLIQAHAEVVSRFVAHGFVEARKNHPVPAN